MAKCKFGATIDGIRGSVGGVTFSANGSGPYLKAYRRPIIRTSTDQMPLRQHLAQAGYQWDQLTVQQRADWDDFADAPNEIDKDAWDDQRFLTGFLWFVRAAQRRYYVNGTWPDDAPSGAAQTPLTGLSVFAAPYPGAAQISWTAPHIYATDALIADAAISTHPNAVTPQGYPLIIAAVADAGDGPIDIDLMIAFRIGLLVSGQKLFVRAWNQMQRGPRSVCAYATCIIS